VKNHNIRIHDFSDLSLTQLIGKIHNISRIGVQTLHIPLIQLFLLNKPYLFALKIKSEFLAARLLKKEFKIL